MATCSPSNSIAGNGAVELEAMRKEDSSWQPCQVSLSSTGVGLIVDYGSNDVEDIIVNEEEALARLRIRSVPLHGDDCVHIQEGGHVLVTQKSQSKSLFFDAEVEKALRVGHSKKVHCRCTFIIKWLHQDHKGGTLTVPSGSIMKLATESINVHPTICAFLRTLKSLTCSSTSPLPTIVDDMDSEMDLQELLEKQIEEICNSADVSKKRISSNIVVDIGVDNKGQIHCRGITGSKVSKLHFQDPPDQNHLKRTTRSTNKLQMEMEVKDLPSPAPSIQEELSESKSPLNPLAARAALASLMSKMPQILEFSIYHEEKLDYTYSSGNISCKHDVLQSLNGVKSCNSTAGNSLSMINSIPFDPEPNRDVKSLISTSSASGKPHHMDASSGIPRKEQEDENKTSEIPDSRTSFACSVAKRKLSQPAKPARPTRSAIEKGAAIPDDTIEKRSCVEEKLEYSTNPRSFTRSAVHEVKETQNTEAKPGMEEHIWGNFADSDSDDQNSAVLGSYVLKDEKPVISRIDCSVELLSTKERNSLQKVKEGNKKHQVDCAGSRHSTSVSRLTDSAVQAVKGNTTINATHGLEDDKLAQNMKSNSYEGDVNACKSSVLKTSEWTSSPLDAEGDLPPSEERHNKGKMSSAVKTTRKSEGKVTGNGESSGHLKRKCTSSKKELRFSPRLRFLPRTRSQNKT